MKAIVYSKENCMYCVLAKSLLEDRKVEFEEIDAPSHMTEMMEAIKAAGSSPPRSVPQIFLEGRHIGGYSELARLFRVQT